MKKMKFIMFITFAMVVFLQSCNDGDSRDYATNRAISTVRIVGDDYHFELDNDETVFPGAKKYNGTYDLVDKDDKSKDGKRAIIDFSIMDQSKEDFTYNAAIYWIDDILTKPVDVATTEEELEPFGDAPIRIIDAWTNKGWLNILYEIRAEGRKSHRISLVDNKSVTPPSNTPEGYTYLEFLHHEHNDGGYQRYVDYVSYELGDDYDTDITNAKGFYIKIINFSGNAEYITIEKKSNDSRKIEDRSIASNFSF